MAIDDRQRFFFTDEYVLNSAFVHGLGFGFATVARPREYGASLSFRFE